MSIQNTRMCINNSSTGADEGMDTIFYTLQDFLTHTKAVVYILIIVTLVLLAGFWSFLTERDQD